MIDNAWAKKQREVIDKQDTVEGYDGIEFRHVPKVRCCCGKLIFVKDAYRCYYCNKYFCKDCAPVHFGKTREQYEAEKLQDAK